MSKRPKLHYNLRTNKNSQKPSCGTGSWLFYRLISCKSQDTTKSTFKEYLLPLNCEKLLKQINVLNLDKYTKKLDVGKFSKLLIFAQLTHINSLGDISLELRTCEELQRELELTSISSSQLSRKLRDLEPRPFEMTLNFLMGQVHREFGFAKGTQAP